MAASRPCRTMGVCCCGTAARHATRSMRSSSDTPSPASSSPTMRRTSSWAASTTPSMWSTSPRTSGASRCWDTPTPSRRWRYRTQARGSYPPAWTTPCAYGTCSRLLRHRASSARCMAWPVALKTCSYALAGAPTTSTSAAAARTAPRMCGTSTRPPCSSSSLATAAHARPSTFIPTSRSSCRPPPIPRSSLGSWTRSS